MYEQGVDPMGMTDIVSIVVGGVSAVVGSLITIAFQHYLNREKDSAELQVTSAELESTHQSVMESINNRLNESLQHMEKYICYRHNCNGRIVYWMPFTEKDIDKQSIKSAGKHNT